MKFSQIATYAMLFLCAVVTYSQSQDAAPVEFSSEYHVNDQEADIRSSLNSESHKMLFAAVKATDLEDVLGMSGPFTVFAPTDNAFAKFTAEKLEELFKEENKTKLKSLLTYHIVAGNLTASKMLRAMCRGEGKATFTTVQGNKIMASMQGTDIVLTDGFGNQAKITAADVGQRNGVIHQIDSVILPTKI